MGLNAKLGTVANVGLKTSDAISGSRRSERIGFSRRATVFGNERSRVGISGEAEVWAQHWEDKKTGRIWEPDRAQ